MAALSTLRGYVRDELGELTAGQWSDAQINAWLNRGVDYLVAEFHRGKCWPLLRPLTKYKEATIAASLTEYTMWDVVENTTAIATGGTSTNDWYGWIHGMLGDYVLHQETIKGYHKLIATYGEHAPSTTEPYIVFNGYDRTAKFFAYTGGGTVEPVRDGMVSDVSDAVYARLAFIPEPTSGTWAGGDAAGDLYIYDVTGTFSGANPAGAICYFAPDGSAKESDLCTLDPAQDATTESHANSPLFTIYPSLTSSATLKVWFLIQPTAMSAATDTPDVTYDCDELLVLYAAARGWKAVQRFEMHAAFQQEFQQELQKKIADYSQTTFKSL